MGAPETPMPLFEIVPTARLADRRFSVVCAGWPLVSSVCWLA